MIDSAAAQGGANVQVTPTAAESFDPIEVEVVESCCASRVTPASGVPHQRVVDVPRGTFLDAETHRRLKRAAAWRTDVPKGIEVGEVSATDLDPEPGAPRLMKSFEGHDMSTSHHNGFEFFPPDTIIAAGPETGLQAVNSALRLYTLNNTNVQVQSLNNHFGVKEDQSDFDSFLFDPKVIYDHMADRFIIVVLELSRAPKKSFLHVSISRGSDPATLMAPADWCNYRFSGKKQGSWADYPGLGANESWIGITANNFKFSGPFHNVYIHVIAKSGLMDNATGSCPKAKRFLFKAPVEAAGDIKASTLQPANHLSMSGLEGTPLFFLSTLGTTSTNGFYGLWQIINTGAPAPAKPKLQRTFMMTDLFDLDIPDARQKKGGIDLDTGNARLTQAVFINGELWGTHTTACALGGAPNETCIRVVMFDTLNQVSAATPSAAVGYETTFGKRNQYLYWPAIMVNEIGDVVSVFQRSGKKLFLGTAYNGKKAGNTKFDAIKPLAKGKCNIEAIDSKGRNRTGDYNGAALDPVGRMEFWISGEYAKKFQTGGKNCNWATKIGRTSY